MPTSSSPIKEGGLKGFFTRASNSFIAGGMYCKEKSLIAGRMAANLAFIVATTSMVVLMPLIFEIMREGQLIESDKLHVKELRTQGYSDNQLRELGFPKIALGQAPAVLKSL